MKCTFCKMNNLQLGHPVRHKHNIGDKSQKYLIYLNLTEFGKQYKHCHKQHLCGSDSCIKCMIWIVLNALTCDKMIW